MIVELSAIACYCKRCYISDTAWQPSSGEYCPSAGGAKHDWIITDVLVYRAVGEWGVVRQEVLPVCARGAGVEPATSRSKAECSSG